MQVYLNCTDELKRLQKRLSSCLIITWGLQKLTSGQIKLGRQIKIRHFGMKTN